MSDNFKKSNSGRYFITAQNQKTGARLVTCDTFTDVSGIVLMMEQRGYDVLSVEPYEMVVERSFSKPYNRKRTIDLLKKLLSYVKAGRSESEALLHIFNSTRDPSVMYMYLRSTEAASVGEILSEVPGIPPEVIAAVKNGPRRSLSETLESVIPRLEILQEVATQRKVQIIKLGGYLGAVAALWIGFGMKMLPIAMSGIYEGTPAADSYAYKSATKITAACQYLFDNFFGILPALAAIVTILGAVYAIPTVRRYLDRLILSLPVIGHDAMLRAEGAIASTLYIYLKPRTVSKYDALLEMAGGVSNTVYKDILEESVISVKAGNNIGTTLIKYGDYFTREFMEGLNTGEETNTVVEELENYVKLSDVMIKDSGSRISSIINYLGMVSVGLGIIYPYGLFVILTMSSANQIS